MQFLQAFWGKLQEYMETRISLLKIEIKEEIAKAVSYTHLTLPTNREV